MARVKLAPFVTNIAGSIGGLTFQRNKFGMTLRVKPLPIKKQTDPQYSIRRKIAFLQNEWQALTDAQRLQWDRFLDFSGQGINHDRSVKMSGHSLFLKWQLMLLISNAPVHLNITYNPLPEVALPTGLEIDGAFHFLNFDIQIVAEEYFFSFFCTNPRKPSEVFSKRGLRYMLITHNASTQFDIKAPYLAAFGSNFIVGDTIHWQIQYYHITSPVFSGKFTGKFVVV